MYKVIKHFTDLQDNRYAYFPGDEFPRDGLKATKKRLNELASDNNKQGTPLIELVEEPKEADTDEPDADVEE